MQELYSKKTGLYYKINGFLPQRPTFVFVHGLTGSSSAWIPYEQEFEKKYNILSFDLRGHGKSFKPEKYEDYAIEKFSDDLFGLLQELSVKDFLLISHSFGTLVALEFLSAHPGLASGAVFLSPSFSFHQKGITKFVKPIAELAAHCAAYFIYSGRPKGHLDYRKYFNTGDWNARRIIADLRATTLRVYFFSMRQSYEFDKEAFLEKIDIPSLMVHGAKDTIFPKENSLIMSRKIKNSQLIILPRANHILVLNNFKEISQAIENFAAKNNL
jgi:3-oxoadipate enol-lactonase